MSSISSLTEAVFGDTWLLWKALSLAILATVGIAAVLSFEDA